MNNIRKTKFQAHCIVLLAVSIMQSAAHGATEITGTVTEKQTTSVKVEFKPHKTAGPNDGDGVDFKTIIQGYEVNAGQGEVTEVNGNFVWVRILKGSPNLKMIGTIAATGVPVVVKTLQAKPPVAIPKPMKTKKKVTPVTLMETGYVEPDKIKSMGRKQGRIYQLERPVRMKVFYPETNLFDKPSVNSTRVGSLFEDQKVLLFGVADDLDGASPWARVCVEQSCFWTDYESLVADQ